MMFRTKNLPTVISGVLLAGSLLPGKLYADDCTAVVNTTNSALLKANGVSSQTDAESYYKAIDPNRLRLNQCAWEEANGFPPSASCPANTATGNSRVAVAGHKNISDLGFYRRIEMVVDRRPSRVGNVAYYTVNYTNEADALANTNPVSIVNMEYSPIETKGPDRITKFYIYGTDGSRKCETVFDPADTAHAEHLYLPNACASCHGGGHAFTGTGDVGGGFVAFDLSVFQYDGSPAVAAAKRASNEANVKKLNLGVLLTDPDSPVKTLISGLYGGRTLPRATQNTNYRPSSWDSEQALYNVVVTDCRGCHTLTAIEVLDLNWWKRRTNTLRELMFDPQERIMPNAPYSNSVFWNTNHHDIALDALNRFDAGP
jgi:hypothetical protein